MNLSPSVFIVDDHPLYCKVLTEILRNSEEFKVIGSASDGLAAIKFLRENDVDLLLLDIVIPGVTGLEILAMLQNLKKRTKVVVLSGLGLNEAIASAFSLGAAAYIDKKIDAAEIVETLKAVARGEFPLNSQTSKVVSDMVKRKSQLKPLRSIDLQVLMGLASGTSIKEIAHNAGISISGAYQARARIVARTGANRWEGFAMIAASYGLMASYKIFSPLTSKAREENHISA